LLCNGINGNKKIKVMGEIFNISDMAEAPEKYLDRNFIRDYFRIPIFARHRALGFKFMYGQITGAEFDPKHWGPNIKYNGRILASIGSVSQWLEENDCSSDCFDGLLDQMRDDSDIRIIHLTRVNQLDSYVSFQLALRQDLWIKQKYVSMNKFDVDREDLDAWFSRGKEYEAYYQSLFSGHRLLEIKYEDLVANYADTMCSVLGFLDQDQAAVERPSLSKQNAKKIQDIVSNYDELKLHFTSTEWERYFH